MTETPGIPPQVATGDETLSQRATPTTGRKALPYAALAILVSLSLFAWRHFEDLGWQRERRPFDGYVEAMTKALRERLLGYEMIMQGAAALFLNSMKVTPEEWRQYVEFRQMQVNFPGIVALGVARILRPADLARLPPGLTINPPGEREKYCPILFVTPDDEAIGGFVGFDLLSEPVRSAALERAATTGSAIISGKFALAPAPGRVNPTGLLMCFPLYAAGKTMLKIEERRDALWGYVISVFHMEELISGLSPDASHKIEFEIFDGPMPSPSTLMFDGRSSSKKPSNSMFTANKVLDLYGRKWTIVFHTTPFFDAQSGLRVPRIILGGGLVISMLIFLFLKMLEGSGERALALAQEMTLALKESEAKYRNLSDNVPVGIFAIDPAMRVIALNKQLRRWFPETGYAGRPHCFFALKNPLRSEPCVDCPVNLTMRDNQIHTVERAVETTRGLQFFRATSIPTVGPDGTVAIVYTMVENITQSKKAEARAQAERQRLYLVLETLPAFVVLIGQDHSLSYANRQFRERFGDPASPKWNETLFSKHLQENNSRTFEVFRTGSPEFWEWNGPDGHIYQIHDYPFTDSDGSVLVLELGVDITDQKQVEGERGARHAAEEANYQKSIFLSNMSHEIRTPMNAILGFAQILERDPNLSIKQREQVGSINRSGQHLLALINDILDMSKIEAGMSELKPAVFCLYDLIDDLATVFRSRAEAKHLQFFVERDADLPYYVLADESKIRQILINLLGNAIKFTDVGGVSMRALATSPVAPPAETAKALQLTVEVKDSGPGIPATDLTNIFTPFAQGEAGVIAGGTGLGLPISRRLAKMMGGDITVVTTVGRGSCFHFYMPLEPSDAAVKKKSPAPRLVTGLEPGTGPFRILVVDDMQMNRDLLLDLLRPLGFEIQQAENGAEALTIFDEWAPHAVLMDMRMPVMNGYEATRRIKATKKGHDTPVIAVTASAFKDSEDQILATGVSAYLRKPFRAEELWDALGGCLGLRYVYADDSPVADKGVVPKQLPAINAAQVAALPADILQAMRQAVDEGDMTRLAELIDQVEPQDADIAQVLHALANRYDYVQLGHLLDKGEKSDA